MAWAIAHGAGKKNKDAKSRWPSKSRINVKWNRENGDIYCAIRCKQKQTIKSREYLSIIESPYRMRNQQLLHIQRDSNAHWWSLISGAYHL